MRWNVTLSVFKECYQMVVSYRYQCADGRRSMSDVVAFLIGIRNAKSYYVAGRIVCVYVHWWLSFFLFFFPNV